MIERLAGLGFDLLPLAGGRTVVAVRGHEIHCEVRQPTLCRRREIRALLQSLLDERMFLSTRAACEDLRANRFITALGFKPAWTDGTTNYYMLTEAPFSPKTKES